MSKEKENKFVEIEDPLASLGFNDDEAEILEEAEEQFEEQAEEIIGGADEAQVTAFEMKESKLDAVKEKAADVMKPVLDIAGKKVSVKLSAIIIAAVAVVAIGLAILIFSLYSSAVYTSGKSVEDWAKEWNKMEFTDSCRYLYEDQMPINLRMGTMLNSDTDHVRLTDEDIKALEKGETVNLLDDAVELSVETYKGDFDSVTLRFDYTELCEIYYGEDYVSDSSLVTNNYMNVPSDDVLSRLIAYMGMVLNPLNDGISTDSDMFTDAFDMYINSRYNGFSTSVYDEYTYVFYYDNEPQGDVSATDLSPSDISATDMEEADTHLVFYVFGGYTKSGQKKHEADWSWWNDIFDKKDKETAIPDELAQHQFDDISLTDADEFSGSDVTATDKAE